MNGEMKSLNRYIQACILLLIFSASACISLSAKGNFSYSGFSGGMMLHTGYVAGGPFQVHTETGTLNASVSGATMGIGGAIRLHFGKMLRIGSEGYTSTVKYGESGGSYFKSSWGGVFAGVFPRFGKFIPYAGLTVGGGSSSNLYVQEPGPGDFFTEKNVMYRKYSYVAMAPFVGMDYELTKAIKLTVKADYMFNVSNPSPDFASGVRIYVGVVFYRLKN